MQKIERVEGQELNTTEQRTEVYTDSIQESISNYCIDHDIEIKDIYTFDQQRWNSVALLGNSSMAEHQTLTLIVWVRFPITP